MNELLLDGIKTNPSFARRESFQMALGVLGKAHFVHRLLLEPAQEEGIGASRFCLPRCPVSDPNSARLKSLLPQRRLCRRQPGDRHAEWRAAHIIQPDP